MSDESNYLDEEVVAPRPTRSRSSSPRRTHVKQEVRSSSNAGIIAGIALAGVGIIAAVGARIIFKKRPVVAPTRPTASSRGEGRRKVPPRRPRSTTSGASSRQPSPPTSAASTPMKAGRQASNGPALPPRRKAAATPPASAPAPVVPTPVIVEEKNPIIEEPDVVATAATAVTSTVAAVVADKATEAPATSVYTEPNAEELKKAAADAVKETETAVAAGDVEAAAQAAENLEDVVDDQIALANEQAVEAVVGLVDAAIDAEEVVEEAEQIMSHAEAKEEKEEPEPVNSSEKEGVTEHSAKEPATEEPTAEEPVKFEAVNIAPETPIAPPIVPDEPEDQYETLPSIPHPELKIEGAPSSDDPFNDIESRIRDMSIAAHKHIKDNHNKLGQAIKEQGAALDLALSEEGAGKVRPNLIAACAFALADMLVAQRRINETKVALATAYAAAQHNENKGAIIRALTNYAYVLRGEGKVKSIRTAYETALETARSQFGVSHPYVEQVKYEYSNFLAKTGRLDEAAVLLIDSSKELLSEAETLEKTPPATTDEEKKNKKEEQKQEENSAKEGGSLGTGFEHLQQEAEEESAQEQRASLPPHLQAKHFAMRTLINASEIQYLSGNPDESENTLQTALDLATQVHGDTSVQYMNILYSMATLFKRQGRIQDAINACENVLTIMDENIEVYEPDLLQNRISILHDTAKLYDLAGDSITAIDYATGALVNAQTLAKIMAQLQGAPTAATASMLEPFWLHLADLKAKSGDAEGAAEARREALRGKLNQGLASRGGRKGASQSSGRGASGSGGLKRSSTKEATRAGGRRV